MFFIDNDLLIECYGFLYISKLCYKLLKIYIIIIFVSFFCIGNFYYYGLWKDFFNVEYVWIFLYYFMNKYVVLFWLLYIMCLFG